MARRMAYFRVKRLRLGKTYERFLEENLSEGATLFVAECGLKWPTTRVGERHVFQFGALGGATPIEFLRGSERIEDYLARYGLHRRRWDPPEPDGERPEAEWGFEPILREDIERFARERGYRVRRVVFEEPEDPSLLVADLYRRWYGERGLPANRLLVESFILIEPWWALRTGSVPFWMVFNMEPSAARLERYLEGTDPYDHIHLMLFSHGVDSVGLASIERWRSTLRRAREHGGFVGVDEQRFPRDFAAFVRYHTDLKKIPTRCPMPGPLSPGSTSSSVVRLIITRCGGPDARSRAQLDDGLIPPSRRVRGLPTSTGRIPSAASRSRAPPGPLPPRTRSARSAVTRTRSARCRRTLRPRLALHRALLAPGYRLWLP
jgi:hypothetical protein